MKIGMLLAGVLLVGVLVVVPPLTHSALGQVGEAGRTSVTVSLPAVADVYLAAELPNNNFNSPLDFDFLEVDYWHESPGNQLLVRVFLIRFDLTTLPAEAIIDSAALQLHPRTCFQPGTYPVPLGAFFVTSTWDEDTVTFNTKPTWATLGVNTQ